MTEFKKVTEEESHYRNLEKMSVEEILININNEDKTIPAVVEKAIPAIKKLVSAIADKMLAGGRLFYIGAGTSGRLGILDASECPPTFGVEYGLITGIIAGGEKAMTQAIEFAEDDKEQGWLDLREYHVRYKDVVVGLSASGSTPYVLAALEKCRSANITTGCVVCNQGSPVASVCHFPVEVVTGPEFITASTRMKSGTAQKLVLNMISTAVMIQLGRVEGNRMVNMQLTNTKLIDRGVKMVMLKTGISDYEKAKQLLLMHGSVKKVDEKD